ncbi:MAG TPA: hypothetical protein DCY13_20040, partial [Verrucomicrobiales bacterium]|nr:hypothetical protein [Verrucomicrobiales bacterium]
MRSPIVVAGGHVPDHPRLLRPRPGRRLLPGLAFVALLLSAAADEPLVLTPTGISAGALQVQVTGQGARYFVDVSTNLVDWQEVHSAALT